MGRWIAPWAWLLLALLPTGCGSPSDDSPPIRIGHLTETHNWDGHRARDAVRLLVHQTNAQGGLELADGRRRIELFEIETGRSPENASAATLELINRDRVSAIVGPYRSDMAIPAGGTANRAGVVLVTPTSSHPATTADRPFVFRANFVDPVQAAVLVRFATRGLDARRVAILFDATRPYNRNLAGLFRDAAEARGLEVVAEETYEYGETRFRPAMARIAAAAPDVLFLPNFLEDLVRQARAAQDAGLDARLLGSDSWNATAMPLDDSFEGACFSQSWHLGIAPSTPSGPDFVADFRAWSGQEPTDTAALAWDGAQLILAAIVAAGNDEPGAIRDALAELGPFEGVTGELEFRGHGDPHRTVHIFCVHDGRVERVESVPPQAQLDGTLAPPPTPSATEDPTSDLEGES